jgi:hypothetical protein
MSPVRRIPRLGSFRAPALAVALLLAASCAPADEAPPGQEAPAEPAAEAVPVDAGAERDAVMAAAQPVGQALMQTLSSNLVAAMEADGPVGAMEFCNVEAIPLTRQVTEEQGMEVFRTSLKLRNPQNAPDEFASQALDWYQDQIAAGGDLPVSHVQKLPNGDYRYYQALQMGEPCLRCHGAPEQLAPGIPEALTELYPEDQATGYALGDWRGLLGITVPAAAVEAGQ